MEFVFKDMFLTGNEIPFYILCGSIFMMIVICFLFGFLETKKNK